jgi:4a-hydroxytetrahydrobiopterin dehydratase
MVDTLAGKTCTPCKGGIPPLALQEAERLRGEVPQWELRDGGLGIERHRSVAGPLCCAAMATAGGGVTIPEAALRLLGWSLK